MKKSNLIKTAIVATVIWLGTVSCYWGPYAEDLRVYIFHPSTSVSPDLYPYFYSTMTLNRYWQNVPTAPDENISEWYNYLNQKVDKKDIEEFIYNSKIKDLENHLKLNYYWWDNPMPEYLQKIGRKDVIKYIIFAKKTEKLLAEGDPWYGDNYDRDAIHALIDEGKIAVEKNLFNDFIIKQRYAYQIVMMHRYLGEYDKAVGYYEKIFGEIPPENESIIKYWALSHAAVGTKDKKQSQLRFLEAFINSHSKKIYCRSQINKNYFAEIQNDLTEEQKVWVMILNEYQYPGRSLENLKKIAEHDPNSENFKALMVREVNKIEDWLLTRKYANSEPAIGFWGGKKLYKTYEEDFKYLGEYIKFLESTLKNKKIEDKGLWELTLSHLYLMYEMPQMAIIHLNKAEKLVETDSELAQLRITRILTSLISSKKYDENFEQKLWEDLSWLVIDKKYNQANERNFTNLMLAIQQNYHDKKMYDKAAIFMAYEIQAHRRDWSGRWWDYSDVLFYLDRYASISQVENFMQVVENKNKEVFEKFLLDDFKYDKDQYYDLLGTMALRKNDLKNAKKHFAKIDEIFWKQDKFRYYSTRNPFVFYEYYFESNRNKEKFDYKNKLQFVEQLDQKIKKLATATGEEKTLLALEIANAYYNMSYYGRNWLYVCYGKSQFGGRLTHTTFNTYVNQNYFECTTALQYYNKALQSASADQKPEILLAMTLVHDNSQIFKDQNFDDPSISDYENRTWSKREQYFKSNDEKAENIYIKKLRTDFKTSYDDFIRECPGIASY